MVNVRLTRWLLAAGLVSCVTWASSAALAQAPAAPPVPGGQRSELEQAGNQIRRAPTGSGLGPVEGQADQGTQTGISPESTFSFTLKGLSVEGMTVFSQEDIAITYESFIDTDVTIGSLREIADRIERYYRKEGYVATRVIIPPQAIRDGVPKLQVFEGKIIHYEINGEIGPVKKQIARLLDNLLTDKPARWSDLERYLLLARDLPGISLTGTLRSAGDSAPGGVILVVDAARKAVDGFANFQNRNAEPTGPFTVSAGAALNSNTEFAERLGAVGLLALEVPEQVTGFLSYEQSVGNDGMIVRLSGTQGFSDPKDELEPLKLETFSTIVTLEAEYPIVRSRDFSIWTRGGMEYLNQRTRADKREIVHDQYLSLFGGVRGIWQQPLGGLVEFDLVFRQGLGNLGVFGIESVPSRPNPGGVLNADFSLVRGTTKLTQPLPPFFEVYLEVQGQYASQGLPSFEEMALGELTIGRGYEPGDLVGDSGFGGKGELRFYPPGVEAWWLESFQVYGFFDYARVFDRDAATGNNFEELFSGGFGVRFQVFETVFGDVYYAQPMTRGLSTEERIPEPTVRFTVTKFF